MSKNLSRRRAFILFLPLVARSHDSIKSETNFIQEDSSNSGERPRIVVCGQTCGDEAADEVKKLTDKNKAARSSPRILYIGVASYEDQSQRESELKPFKVKGFETSFLDITTQAPNLAEMRKNLSDIDVVLMGDGNALYAATRMKYLGVDSVIRRAAFQQRVVLVGSRAGAALLFDGGRSDSANPRSFKNSCTLYTWLHGWFRRDLWSPGLGIINGMISAPSLGNRDAEIFRYTCCGGIGLDQDATLIIDGLNYRVIPNQGEPGIWSYTFNTKTAVRAKADGAIETLIVGKKAYSGDQSLDETRLANPDNSVRPGRELLVCTAHPGYSLVHIVLPLLLLPLLWVFVRRQAVGSESLLDEVEMAQVGGGNFENTMPTDSERRSSVTRAVRDSQPEIFFSSCMDLSGMASDLRQVKKSLDANDEIERALQQLSRYADLRVCVWARNCLISWRDLQTGGDCDGQAFLKVCEPMPEVYNWIFSSPTTIKQLTRDYNDNIAVARDKWPAGATTLKECLHEELRTKGLEGMQKQYWDCASMRILWIQKALTIHLKVFADIANTTLTPQEMAQNSLDAVLAPYLNWMLLKTASFFIYRTVYANRNDVFVTKLGLPKDGVPEVSAICGIISKALSRHVLAIELMFQEEAPALVGYNPFTKRALKPTSDRKQTV